MGETGGKPGRKQAPPRIAKAIQGRLRRFFEEDYGSVYKFAEGYPRLGAESHLGREAGRRPQFNRKTVLGWLRGNRIPDTMSVIQLAGLAELNPQFLLLGEGDRLRGVQLPPEELGRWLHQKIDAELRADGLTPLDIDDYLPDPDDLLKEVVEWYRKRCGAMLSKFQQEFGQITLDSAQEKFLLLQDYLRVAKRRRKREPE